MPRLWLLALLFGSAYGARTVARALDPTIVPPSGHRALSGAAPLMSVNQPIVFAHATVISLATPDLQRDQTVIVDGNRIIAVGHSTEVPVPRNARVIDATGMYLMPGLSDMHVHVERIDDLAMYLANGVTTVLNLRGSPWHLTVRSQLERGELIGPRMLTCGPYIRGGKDRVAVVAAADSILGAGYDCVKIKDNWTPEAYRAVAMAVIRRNGILVGHAPRNLPFDTVAMVGTQRIAHLEELVYTTRLEAIMDSALASGESPELVLGSERALHRELVRAAELASRASLWITPTSVVIQRYALRASASFDSLLRESQVRYLDAASRRRWEQARVSASTAPAWRLQLQVQQQLLAELHRRGVPLVAGTDAESGSNLMVMPGWSLHQELELMVAAGLTPYDALRTATVNAAAYFGQSDRDGCIRVGCRADLLLLRANPLEDIRHTTWIHSVMADGRWFGRAELDEQLETLVRHNSRTTSRAREVETALGRGGVTAAIRTHRRFGTDQDLATFTEVLLNSEGYRLLREGNTSEAIRTFAANAQAFPGSVNAWDSWGDALLTTGDSAGAVDVYRRGLVVALRQHGDARDLYSALDRLAARGW